MRGSRPFRLIAVLLHLAPGWSLHGRGKVVAKSGPFPLTFCHIVALMFPHRNVVDGRLDELLVAILFSPCVK